MFFKNLQIYRIQEGWNINLATFEEQVARGAFVKCPSNQPQSRGWVSPRNDGALVYAQNQQWMISLAVEQRLLPSSVVNDEVKERAEKVEEQQGYAPGRKQLKELKERVIEELMPRAFTRTRKTFVWIDPINGWFVVDAPSASKAEETIEHLRHCLDEFPLKMLHTQLSPISAMADWLAGGESPPGFTIDQGCQLKGTGDEKSVVTYDRCTLDGDEVKGHLAGGKLPTKLAMTWDDRISFVLTEKLEVKRVALIDISGCEIADNAQEQFDADFALMTGEIARMLPHVVEVLGGEVVDLVEQGGGSPAAPIDTHEDADTDPVYGEAVAIVKAEQRASISLVQRHLRIGYNRAARLIERMEKEGLISPMNKVGVREVINVS